MKVVTDISACPPATNPDLWRGGPLCHCSVLSCQQAEEIGPSGTGAWESRCKQFYEIYGLASGCVFMRV